MPSTLQKKSMINLRKHEKAKNCTKSSDCTILCSKVHISLKQLNIKICCIASRHFTKVNKQKYKIKNIWSDNNSNVYLASNPTTQQSAALLFGLSNAHFFEKY